MKLGFLFIFIALQFLWVQSARSDSDIAFIVNAQNPVTEISLSELKNFYYKRKRTWSDGTSVRFIDRAGDLPCRKIFINSYLEKSIEDLELYWIGQKLYSGDSAPLKEASDHMTIQFVGLFKGAIGYVPASINITSDRVKVIRIRDKE